MDKAFDVLSIIRSLASRVPIGAAKQQSKRPLIRLQWRQIIFAEVRRREILPRER